MSPQHGNASDRCALPGCDSYDRMHRRTFLRATGVAGLASLLGMSVRDLLAAQAASDLPSSADQVILLWMSGGMSHIDTLDPKPGRPTAGEFKPIRTSVDGLDISEILPKTAEVLKHAAVIRSISGEEGDHGRATYHLQTGYRPDQQFVHPALGSIAAHELEQQTALPSFFSVGGRAASAGYLGQTCEAYYIGEPDQPDPHLSIPKGIEQGRYDRRLELLQGFNAKYADQSHNPAVVATDQSYDAALKFLRSPALKAFDLETERPEVREAYGMTPFGQGALLARRLAEQGVRFVQVNLGGFDTHQNNFPAMRQLGSVLDPAMSRLIGDLAASGRLKRTMVILLSEFGRTPRVNGNAGRDHHPGVFSCLMAGGGVKPGMLYGSSDEDGYRPAEQAVRVPDIHATVCAALGIDYHKHIHTPLGRPMPLVQDGSPIRELLNL